MARIKEPYVKVTERVREYPTLLNIDGTSILAGVVVSPKGRDLQYISGPRDFLDKMVGADELPRNSHISLINAFYCSYFSGLVLARSMDKTGSVTYMHKLTGGDWSTLPVLEGQIMNTKAILTWNLQFTDSDKWAYEMNGTTFYHGLTSEEFEAVVPALYGVTGPKAQVDSLTDIASIMSSWTGFLATVNNGKIELEFNSPVTSTEGDVKDMLGLNTNIFIRKEVTQEGETTEVDVVEPINNRVKVDSVSFVANYEDYLGITLKDTSMYDYRFVFTGSGPAYTLSIYKDSTLSSLLGQFHISLDPMGVDEEGNSNFIENLNSQFEDIKFEVANEAQEAIASLELGEVKMSTADHLKYDIDNVEAAEPKYLSAAAYRLANQSRYPIDYLADFGITTSSFLKDLVYIGRENFWFAPVDIPYSYTNSAAIKMFGDGISNVNQTMICGPFDKNTAFLGYPCKIAWSSLYYERVFANKANGAEFAPAFEQTNGVLSYHEPACQLSDSDREALLNAPNGPINFVVFDHSTNLYYANDNRCHTTDDNIASDENNRRLINKINRDVKQIMKRFKGRVNDNETRVEVESVINLYIAQNIMNQTYKPNQMRAVCDSSNNDEMVIAAQQMHVTVQQQLYRPTRWIDILSDSYPIGVDFVA